MHRSNCVLSSANVPPHRDASLFQSGRPCWLASSDAIRRLIRKMHGWTSNRGTRWLGHFEKIKSPVRPLRSLTPVRYREHIGLTFVARWLPNMAQWSNWSGLVQCAPRELLYPTSEEEVSQIVRRATAEGNTVRVAGTGHSFMPLVATDDVLLSLDRLAGLESVDAAARRAWIWAGTKIHDLGAPLAAHGLALENQGDVDVQALAGAVRPALMALDLRSAASRLRSKDCGSWWPLARSWSARRKPIPRSSAPRRSRSARSESLPRFAFACCRFTSCSSAFAVSSSTTA